MRKWIKNILVLFLIGFGLFVMDHSASGGFENKSFQSLLSAFGIYQLYTFVIGLSNMLFFDVLRKRKWKQNDIFKRIILGFLISIILTLVCLFFLNMFTDIYFNGNKVVPLSLQLLLENAVKHNMVMATKPLHIRIYEDQGSLVVENNLQPKQIVKKSTGVGLSNIMQRYNLLTNKKVKL